MVKIIIAILTVFLTGCATKKEKTTLPPTVSTAQVIQSLENTKTELEAAGESNTKVAKNIDRALTLAERLDQLLEQIEREYEASIKAKQIIEPMKL
jgi:predicted outer membrane protein